MAPIISSKRDFTVPTQKNKKDFILTLIIISYVISVSAVFLFKLQGVPTNSIIQFSIPLFATIISLNIYWYLQLSTSIVDSKKQAALERKSSILRVLNEVKGTLVLYSKANEQGKIGNDGLAQFNSHLRKLINTLETYNYPLRYSHDILTQQIMLDLFFQTISMEITSLEKELNINEQTSTDDNNKISKDIELTRKISEQTIRRIAFEIQLERKRSTIYIMFGSVITMVAGYVLYDSVQGIIRLQQQTGSIDIQSILTRLSIVIFIEIFAFYYLRLYNRISDNIKYYQNEMTNVEMKSLCFYALRTGEARIQLRSATLAYAA